MSYSSLEMTIACGPRIPPRSLLTSPNVFQCQLEPKALLPTIDYVKDSTKTLFLSIVRRKETHHSSGEVGRSESSLALWTLQSCAGWGLPQNPGAQEWFWVD